MIERKQRIVLIVHNVRSAHNVGSILRSADGLGAEKIYLTGYTPYPHRQDDKRLPHIAKRASSKIAKTALGADSSIEWEHASDIDASLRRLKQQGFIIAALEQAAESVNLADFRPPQPVAVIVGSETAGIDEAILNAADTVLAIPMLGAKESFNVAIAAAIALYHLRWYNQTPDDRQNKNGFAKIRPSPNPQTKRGK
jgi:tRNA G18 (ribose-2'-O)-methylase SpoU